VTVQRLANGVSSTPFVGINCRETNTWRKIRQIRLGFSSLASPRRAADGASAGSEETVRGFPPASSGTSPQVFFLQVAFIVPALSGRKPTPGTAGLMLTLPLPLAVIPVPIGYVAGMPSVSVFPRFEEQSQRTHQVISKTQARRQRARTQVSVRGP